MRTGTTLTEKALLALEEALQDARYRVPDRTHALRFALAYLHTVKGTRRDLFDAFWRALFGPNDLHRFQYADRALGAIYDHLGTRRDDEVSARFWREAHDRFQRDRT